MVSFRKTYDSHAAVARLLPNQHQAVMRFARNCYLLCTCVEELINNNNIGNTTTVRMDRCIQTQWQRFLFNQYYRRMKWFYDFGGGARRINRCFFCKYILWNRCYSFSVSKGIIYLQLSRILAEEKKRVFTLLRVVVVVVSLADFFFVM